MLVLHQIQPCPPRSRLVGLDPASIANVGRGASKEVAMATIDNQAVLDLLDAMIEASKSSDADFGTRIDDQTALTHVRRLVVNRAE